MPQPDRVFGLSGFYGCINSRGNDLYCRRHDHPADGVDHRAQASCQIPGHVENIFVKVEGYTSQPEELAGYKGKTGKAITDLRPAGTAMIDDQRVDVVSRGEYIDKGASIRVLAVDGNRVVVKKL